MASCSAREHEHSRWLLSPLAKQSTSQPLQPRARRSTSRSCSQLAVNTSASICALTALVQLESQAEEVCSENGIWTCGSCGYSKKQRARRSESAKCQDQRTSQTPIRSLQTNARSSSAARTWASQRSRNSCATQSHDPHAVSVSLLMVPQRKFRDGFGNGSRSRAEVLTFTAVYDVFNPTDERFASKKNGRVSRPQFSGEPFRGLQIGEVANFNLPENP